MINKMQNRILIVLLTTILIIFSFSPLAIAADPGHGAAVIGPGSFEAGNYAFPNNITIGGSNFFVNNGTGRVGIGTTSPQTNLHIVGGNIAIGHNNGLQLWNGSTLATVLQGYGSYSWGYNFEISPGNELIIGGGEAGSTLRSAGLATGANEYLHLASDVDIRFWTNTQVTNATFNNVPKAIISTAGQFGIGTTSPTYLLDVRGNVSFNQSLYVTTSGNVGIGTAIPTGNLHIKDTVATLFDPQIKIEGSGGASDVFSIWAGTGENKLNFGYGGILNNGTALTIDVGTGSTFTPKIGINTTSPNSVLAVGGILDMMNNRIVNVSTPTLSTDAATKAYVDSVTGGGSATWTLTSNVVHLNATTNRVSIGGTTSNYKLDVTGNVSLNNSLFVTTSGNVGIGTASPANLLTVRKQNAGGNVGLRIHNLDTTSTSTASIFFGVTTAADYNSSEIRSVRSPGNDLIFLNDGGETFRALGSAGQNSFNVGSGKLFVNGSSGYVGIGTTTPNNQLEVIGTARIESSTNTGDLIFTDGASYGLGNTSDFISSIAGLKGRLVNYNPDFSQGTYEYGVYDNNGTGPNPVLSIVSDATSPSASGKIMNISYDGTGYGAGVNPNPGYGGFYIAVDDCAAQTNTDCYREGNRYIYKIWAKIPSGRSIVFASNQAGSGYTHRWLTSQAGTDKWEQYIAVQKIGHGGTLSTTGFWYISGGTNTAFSWQVASFEMIGVDEPATVEQTKTLNIGYKQNVNLTSGNLLSTTSTYLATDSGNVGIGTTNPLHKLTVSGTFNTTGLSYFGANMSLGGYQINNLGTPKLSTDAATKAYVDALTGGAG
ncbi:MAG: hypothetical protein Q8Q31_02130, partial [Nanoarchaeota archaeon]|nr:hypothetical protein [Nanoarchaeota archaeon]